MASPAHFLVNGSADNVDNGGFSDDGDIDCQGTMLRGGTVVSTAASQLPGTRVRFPAWVTVCVEFAHSLCVCVGFLRMFWFPPTVRSGLD